MKKRRKIIIALAAVAVIAMGALAAKHFITVNREGSSISAIGGADGQAAVLTADKLTGGEKAVEDYTSITMNEAKAIFETEGDYIILDVRRADEFAEGHIPGAINVANEDILSVEPAELTDKNQVIYVYCRSGRRSKEASAKLADLGYTNIIEIGGILDWTGEVEK